MDTLSLRPEINTVWKYQHVSLGIIAAVKSAYLSEIHISISTLTLSLRWHQKKEMLIENKRQHKANVENKDAATYLNI